MSSFYQAILSGSPWKIPERYQNLQLIGCGSYGQVAKASLKQSGREIAIKKLPAAFQSEDNGKQTFRELSVLQSTNHRNVISLLDAFYSPDQSEVYLVTHLMEADLHKTIKNQNLTEANIISFVGQIFSGLAYLHSRGIIHRDLKPCNIAINRNNHLRILDFGLARATSLEMTNMVMTLWYRAPEVIYCCGQYNQSVDVWSVGCIVAELILGKVLLPGENTWHQLKIILEMVGSPTMDFIDKIPLPTVKNCLKKQPFRKRQDFSLVFTNASALAIDLLERTLQFNPDQRISSSEALNHPYLQNYVVPPDEGIQPIYDQSFETSDLTVEDWKRLIIKKIDQFQPPELLS